MLRRRWRWLAATVPILAPVGAFVVFGLIRPAGNTYDAGSAAVNAMWGIDPPMGSHASCDHAPDANLLLLKARYECVLLSCRGEVGRIEIYDALLGGWSYKITDDPLPGYGEDEGSTARASTFRPTPRRPAAVHSRSRVVHPPNRSGGV